MCDRDPVDQWSFGRVTLLGDAAHAMRPNGSNGATQAILDAMALARLLAPAALSTRTEESSASKGMIEAALWDYQEERLPPTTRVVQANRGTGPEKVLQMAHDNPDTPFEELDAVSTSPLSLPPASPPSPLRALSRPLSVSERMCVSR